MDFTLSTSTKQTLVVDAMRTQATAPASVLGKHFLFYPEVFHPGPSLDVTEFMIKELLREIKEDLTNKPEEEPFDFLEVGCGAGYTAILVALASDRCHVWATDINEVAVKNTIENAKLHGVNTRVKAVIADVFNHEILAGKDFDTIYWNIPWLGQNTEPGTSLDMLNRSILDPGYKSFHRYLLEAKNYLKKKGRLFVAFSFNFGSKELFDRVVNETGWSYKVTSRNNFLVEIADHRQEIDVSIAEFLKQD